MELIDIGVNLMHTSFNQDRSSVIIRAKEKGISKQIITGTSVKNSIDAFEYIKKFPAQLYSTAGIHPHNAKDANEDSLATLRDLLKNEQVVAVGECGLDFDRDFSPRDIQEKCFEAHLDLSLACNKPLFLHERVAHQRFTEILQGYKTICNQTVVHCFTGTLSELKTYLDLGCHIV